MEGAGTDTASRVAQGLREVVAECERRGIDPSSGASLRIVTGMLRDRCPDSPERRALIEAASTGAVQSLRHRDPNSAAEFALAAAGSQLVAAGFRDELARWAANAWWDALGLGPATRGFTPEQPVEQPEPGSRQAARQEVTADETVTEDDRLSAPQAREAAPGAEPAEQDTALGVEKAPLRRPRFGRRTGRVIGAVAVVAGYLAIAGAASLPPFSKPSPPRPKAPSAYAQLLSKVPNAGAAGCSHLTPRHPPSGATAAAECTPDAGFPPVYYVLFRSVSTARQYFQNNLPHEQLGLGSCDSSSLDQGSYSVGSRQDVGKLACWDVTTASPSGEIFLWWEFQDRIVAFTTPTTSLSQPELYRYWQSLGPRA